MQNVINAQVLGGKRFDINGTKMASLYVAQPSSDTEGNTIGLEVMKVSCPYALFDTIKASELPGQYEVQVNLKSGAGGKITMEALSLRFVGKLSNQQSVKAG